MTGRIKKKMTEVKKMKVFLKDLTLVQLKEQLEGIGLSAKGTKTDLFIRLEEHLRKENRDTDSYYIEVEQRLPPGNEEVGVKEMFASVVSLVQNLGIQMSNVHQDLDSKILMVTSQLSDQIDTIAGNMEAIKKIEGRVSQIEQDAETSETRMLTVENELDRVKNSMEIVKQEVEYKFLQLQEQVSNQRDKIGPPSVALPFTDGQLDPKVMKDCLPEFHGRLEENPANFIKGSLSLLGRTNLPTDIYSQVVAQQLKGQAATWWQNLKGLNLGWEDFKRELIARFDSEGVKSAVKKKLFTDTQPTGMRASAFIIQKYQLFKRLNPEECEDKAIHDIIELLHDKIRPLVKVSQPKTFDDLRTVVNLLEEEHKVKPPGDPSPVRKCFQCGNFGHLKNKCPTLSFQEN